MTMENQDFWWSNVTGPSSLVSETARTLLEKGCAILALPKEMPWADTFRQAVLDTLRDLAPGRDLLVERMPAGELADGCPPGASPAEQLLERFAAGDEVRYGYRPKSGRSIPQYLADKNVLDGMLVWLTDLDAEHAAPWLELSLPAQENGGGGMLLLEVEDGTPGLETAGMPVLRHADHVRRYDAQVFADFLASRQGGGSQDETTRELIASMAAEICGSDAELMTDLLSDCGRLLESPAAWTDLLRTSADGFGRCASLPAGGALEKAVWAAQMKTIFPLLELERMEIIEAYHADLELALKERQIIQFKKPVACPEELELGTLSWCVSQFMVKGLNGTHARRLHVLHEVRNTLAHGKCAPRQEFSEFLENVRFDWRHARS